MSSSETIALILSGLALGVQHSFDGDHIVAVSAIVSRSKSLERSALLGTLWGTGHTTALLIVGIAVLIFRISIPKSAENLFEALAGAALVAIGIFVIVNVRRMHPHGHRHKHGSTKHAHEHDHGIEPEHHQHHVTFLVGTIQGLAGSAGLMLVILSTINSITIGLAYILFFGIGSIIGMVMMATLMSLPHLKTSTFPDINKLLSSVAAIASIGFGFYLIYSHTII